MSHQPTSPPIVAATLTQHAMLVVWGWYARQIGLVQALEQVRLKQKVRTHRPQTKVLEFLVAILAGLPHLQDISRSGHPLDQDQVTAEAWGQPAWADYSGVSRSLQQLSSEEVDDLIAVLERVSQPFLAQEIELALTQAGCLFYDADLTGRPVSSTSTSYPDTAFGYMGDTVSLGYQAALVSLHSPSYGRLWLANQLHPGDTVSVTQVRTLVQAAERRTGRRPRRRTELVASRLAQAETAAQAASERAERSSDKLQVTRNNAQATAQQLHNWRDEVVKWTADYQQARRQPTAHCKLTRAQRKVATYQARLARCRQAVAVAERRLTRHKAQAQAAATLVDQLRQHQQCLLADNAANPEPIRAVFRLDGGFASHQNIDWLIEMGYDIYLKSRATSVRQRLIAAVTPETAWQRVGGNAWLTAWPATTVEDTFTYPMDVALARYQTGETSHHSVLLHYGSQDVVANLAGWFHTYNGRQTIEAGIKEGKAVFQMHHLKVRSPQALRLQEQFACFAANFVRFAAHWLAERQAQPPVWNTRSVKHLVKVSAHTSAWVLRQGDVWLLMFTEQSLYAGHSLRFGDGAIQLPLPSLQGIHFCHF